MSTQQTTRIMRGSGQMGKYASSPDGVFHQVQLHGHLPINDLIMTNLKVVVDRLPKG
uniref:Uncharacterized protein n=1 Tax=Anopheles funestus TaxID=62324 RepID=A0A182S1F8_ANOFN